MEFNNHEWSRIILRRVHEEIFWVGDIPIVIDNDVPHNQVTRLSNEGFNLVNDKNIRKIVETNLKTKFDGRNMRVDLIENAKVGFFRKIIGYKNNHSSRVNFVLTRSLHLAYVMAIENKNMNMCEIIKVQLSDNIAKMKKSKNTLFIFESLLTYFFLIQPSNSLE